MRIFLPYLFLLALGLLSRSSNAQDCEINFDLFGIDTLCTSNPPFALPPVLPFGGTYSGTNVVDGYFSPEGLPPGDYVITYSVNTETCVGSDDVIMTVIQAETPVVVGDLEICAGDTAKITVEPSVEVTWYDGTKSFFRDFVLDTTFTSTAAGTDLIGCPFNVEFTIRAYDLPDTVAITGTSAVCPGGEATLSLNSGNFFVWFNESSDPTITFTVDEPTEVPVTIYLGADCDTTLSYFVDVVPLPEPIIEADTSICVGDSVVITFSGADYFKDQFGTITSPYTVFPLENFTLFIEAYNSEDCFVTNPVSITVNAYPEVSISGLDEICAGEDLYIVVSGGDYYTWLNLDDGADITPLPDNAFFDQPMDTLRFELTAHSFSECNTIQNYEVPVNPMPQPAIEVINPFCEGEVVTLLASGADNFLWSTGVQDSLLEFIGEEDFTLTLYASNSTGCEDSLVWDVVIHPVPVVTGTGLLSFCEGLSTELVGNGADYYIWNGVFEGDTLVTAPLQDTIINLVGYTEFGCNDFTNININVDPAPFVDIIAPSEICNGESIALEVISNGEIQWSDGSSELQLFFTPAADTILNLVSTANNGCLREVEFPITVHPLPVVGISGTGTVCAGEMVTLTADGAQSYIWNTNNTGAILELVPFADFVYQVRGISEVGCEDFAIFSLTVNPAPYAYFEFNEEQVCDLGPSLTWVANPSGGVLSGDGVSDNVFNPMDAIVGLNTVTYTVTNEFNCTATATDQVVVDDCSGLDEQPIFSFQLYPNPANSLVFFDINAPCTIKVYSSIGMLISEMKLFAKGSLDVAPLPAGLYTISVQSDSGQEESKILMVE